MCEAGIHRLEALHSNLHLASQLRYWQQLWHLCLEWHLVQLWSSATKSFTKIIPPENYFLDLSACAVNFPYGPFSRLFCRPYSVPCRTYASVSDPLEVLARIKSCSVSLTSPNSTVEAGAYTITNKQHKPNSVKLWFLRGHTDLWTAQEPKEIDFLQGSFIIKAA